MTLELDLSHLNDEVKEDCRPPAGLPPGLKNLDLIASADTLLAMGPLFPPGLESLRLKLVVYTDYEELEHARWGPFNNLR